MSKIELLIKHNRFIQAIYVFFGSLFFRFLSIFIRQKKNLMLFSSFGGKAFNDSPKLIYENIYKRYGAKYEYVWAFVDPGNNIVNGAKSIQINSFRYFITALRAKYWITNVNIERGLHFQKKKCIYLNTWHGVCLDYIGNDRPGRKDYNFKKLQYLCINGPFDKIIYKTAFKANDHQFLECGMPRNDCLVNHLSANVEEIKKELGLPVNKKVILYAPTWRENFSKKTDSIFYSPIHIEKWKKAFGDDYIFLFRAHSITKQALNIEFNDFCIDVSHYTDTNRLLLITDILITDYSSICLDFALLDRPFFNFGFDYEEYKINHGFYVDYEKEMPNGIIKTEEELLKKALAYKDNPVQTQEYLKRQYLSYTNGKATDICIEKLFS